MSKTIAFFNQKGGVGKTTSVINTAAALALYGKRVLVVDCDPQGNTTSGFGLDKENLRAGLYDAMMDEVDPKEAILTGTFPGLNILPTDIDLAGAEVELSNVPGRELKLKKVLQKVSGYYDYIFIDCPPSLGLLSLNALAASDSVLIPLQCEFYALEGISQLLNTVNLVRQGLNPNLQIEGVLLTMFDARTNLSLQVMDEIKKYFKSKVYNTYIPRNIRLAEAPSHGLSIFEYDNGSKGAKAYGAFAKEFLNRNI